MCSRPGMSAAVLLRLLRSECSVGTDFSCRCSVDVSGGRQGDAALMAACAACVRAQRAAVCGVRTDQDLILCCCATNAGNHRVAAACCSLPWPLGVAAADKLLLRSGASRTFRILCKPKLLNKTKNIRGDISAQTLTKKYVK